MCKERGGGDIREIGQARILESRVEYCLVKGRSVITCVQSLMIFPVLTDCKK